MRSDPRMRDLMRPQRGLTLALTLCLFREHLMSAQLGKCSAEVSRHRHFLSAQLGSSTARDSAQRLMRLSPLPAHRTSSCSLLVKTSSIPVSLRDGEQWLASCPYCIWLRGYGYSFSSSSLLALPDVLKHPGPSGGRGIRPDGGLMAASSAFCTTYIRCFPFLLSLYSFGSMELPATTVGEWWRRHSL